jgi:1-acyl-sn-glycerol-3-phosphate acyltransferase
VPDDRGADVTSKPLIKTLDRSLGSLARSGLRNFIAHPLFALNYKVEIVGREEALACTSGSIVVANHVSFLDGPFLMNNAWPHARIRATAWHAEYTNWKQWWLMKLFGVISLGSPRQPPRRWKRSAPNREERWAEERTRRTAKARSIMNKVLEADHHLLLFCEGGIGDGNRVVVEPRLSGVHDLIEEHPEKPVLLVKLEGLEHSLFGKKRPRVSVLRRLPVRVTIKRVSSVSLEGGPAGLNGRLENYFNHGTPLAAGADAAS